MSNDSPVVVVYDSNGQPLTIVDGYVLATPQSGMIISGTDGYNGRIVKTDSNGNVIVVGLGAAGAAAGGVVSVQGVAGGFPFSFTASRPSNSATTQVAGSITNVQLLGSNINRLGATIYNDSPSGLFYVKLGSAATTSDFTIKLLPLGYYEIPFGYTGAINGLWTSANGNARITELT